MLNLFEQNVDLNIIADRNNLKRAVPNERLYMQKGAGAKKLCQGKKHVASCNVTSLQDMAEVYEADYLTSADQVISD